MTSSDNYFLSELAYSSSSELTNCVLLSLHVMSLGDKDAHESDETAGTHKCEMQHAKCPCSTGSMPEVNANDRCCDCVESKGSHSPTLDDKTNEENLPVNHCGITVQREDGFMDVDIAVKQLSKMLERDCKDGCFILDIDLDFFSTTNPFLSSLTTQQYQLLSQLYAYQPSFDESQEVRPDS